VQLLVFTAATGRAAVAPAPREPALLLTASAVALQVHLLAVLPVRLPSRCTGVKAGLQALLKKRGTAEPRGALGRLVVLTHVVS
jgi:hypothetical protein